MLTECGSPGWSAWLAALALAVGYLALAVIPGWRADPTRFVALDLLLFAGYAVVLSRCIGKSGQGWGAFIVVAGIVFRAVAFVHAPDLSDDVARYAWDGHLTTHGVNPLARAPADPALIPYRTEEFGRISYKDLPTIYPPAAQALFALAALVQPGIGGVRLIVVLVDVGVMLLLLRILRLAGLPEGRLIVYAWCPLAVVEVASSGHVEPLGVLFLLLVPWALAAGHPASAGVAWAASVLSKIGPLLFAPLVLRRGGWRAATTACIVILGAWLPFAVAGPALRPAISAYAGRWRGGDILFGPLVGLFAVSGLTPPDADRAARIAAAVLLSMAALAAGLRPSAPRAGGVDFLADAARLTALAVLLSPVLHPWYLLWLLPLLCFVPSAPWVLLCGTSVIGYAEDGPVWWLAGLPALTWLRVLPPALLALGMWLRWGAAWLPTLPAERVDRARPA